MSKKKYLIYYGAAKPFRLSERQYNMHDFAVRFPGWHSLGGSGHPCSPEKRTAEALERMGSIELARHTGAHERDWQFRSKWVRESPNPNNEY